MIVNRFDFRREIVRFDWTPASISKMCEMHGRRATFGQIACTMGCSRSAAIGKFNRLLHEFEGSMSASHFDDMLAADAPLEEIATFAGVSVGAVEARLAEIRRELCPYWPQAV